MRYIRIILLASAVLTINIIISSPLYAQSTANLYVDISSVGGNCSDNNSGTLNSPFCTVGKAISIANPATTIHLRSGAYPPFEVTKSGTSGSYITIQGYLTERPVISGGTSGGILLSGKSYIRIKGLEITGASGSYHGGVSIRNGSHHIIVEGNLIHHNSGSSTMGVSIISSSHNTVQNNTIHNNYSCGVRVGGNGTDNQIIGNTIYGHSGSTGGSDGIAVTEQSTRSLIKNNTVYNNSDDGIDTWSSAGNTIIGNTVYGHRGGGDGNGFKLGGTESGGNNLIIGNISYNNKRAGFDSNHSYGNIYYNNTSYGNSGVGFEDINKFATCVHSRCGTILINNIGMNNGRNFAASPHTAVSHNNIWYSGSSANINYQNTTYTTLSAFYAASGNRLDNPANAGLSSLSVDPLFTNPTAVNFSLKLNSPAIDKGDPANPGNILFSGTRVDIGAKEYGLSDPIISTPTPTHSSTPLPTATKTPTPTGFSTSTPTPTKTPTPSPTRVLLQGDINGDGIVNLQDYVLLSNAFGTNNFAADINRDGIVNLQDYVLLSNNFGRTV